MTDTSGWTYGSDPATGGALAGAAAAGNPTPAAPTSGLPFATDPTTMSAQQSGANANLAASPNRLNLQSDSPYTDPAFNAFMRAQGMDESNIQGTLAQRLSSLNRGYALRAPQYGIDSAQAQQGAQEGYEANGLSQSGARLLNQSHIADASQRAQLGDLGSTQDAISQAQLAAAGQIAALRRSSAEQEETTRLNGNGFGYGG